MAGLTRGDLGDLNLFRVIARVGGFRRAALELDVSPSALSHALRGLETRLGVRLFNRTNRAVTLTEAGADLLARLEAGFGAIEEGLEALNRYRGKPAGRLRLNVLTDAARLVLGPALSGFLAEYPEVKLEVVVQDDFVDIVGEGFDAGIRFGGRVPEEMIAVPIGGDIRWVMVASPGYLEGAPPLEHPSDLAAHHCIGLRMGTGAIYHWEVERGPEHQVVDVAWSVVLSETALALAMAETDGGIAYCQEGLVARQLAAGTLVEILPEWSSPGPGFHVYYSSRRQVPEALRALIAFLRDRSTSQATKTSTAT
ncbi:LysR family transcriptional regulator [Methylobacterium aquaticum]|uniref:LysR family transcriptional regulator n=1 Tax=Methylobacterium aquaticum TaxID=270351 RepID=UPI0019345A58|nr:LysR family transcriptional regulator [Methylobacterium aquaticum]QRE76740.1 LysR family transcriptional regulator [Methylobacterium aquaticum]